MPLSPASRLADFGTGIGTAGAVLKVDNPNKRVGIGTQIPAATLGVAGIVSATAFYGDGSNLDGVASAGLGTALSEIEFDPLTVIYQTSDTLSVGATITVDPPDATSKVAYTQYAEIKLENGADLIVAEGDDFIPDILGLSTEGVGGGAAYGNNVFNTVYTDNIEKADGRGAPNFPKGINVSYTGVSTFTGNVSIGGTLTYEDVTNVDSIGVVTARSGIDITGASAGVNGSSNLILKTGGSERSRIDSSGRLLIGSTDSMNVGSATGDGLIQISRTNARVSQSWNAFTADGGGVVISLGKSRSATPGNYDIVQNNDEIGAIRFAGADGTDLVTQAAKITAFVDGAPGVDDMPGRLEFHTTADGAAGPTERLRITKNGAIGIAGANYGTDGQVLTSKGGSAAVQWATPSAGGMVPLLSTNPTSGTEIFATTNLLTSTYKHYRLEFYYQGDSAEMKLQQYVGSAYQTSNTYDYRTNIMNSNNSTWYGQDSNQPFMPVSANHSQPTWQGTIDIYDPTSTSKQTTFVSSVDGWNLSIPWTIQNGNNLNGKTVCAADADGTVVAVTGIKLYGGTITSAFATLYGMKTA